MNELVSFILYVKSCRLEESWAKLETVQHTQYTGQQGPWIISAGTERRSCAVEYQENDDLLL